MAELDDADWQRAGTRRRGERFTVEALARFALHEAHHHRIDAQALLLANELGNALQPPSGRF